MGICVYAVSPWVLAVVVEVGVGPSVSLTRGKVGAVLAALPGFVAVASGDCIRREFVSFVVGGFGTLVASESALPGVVAVASGDCT
jgi:hypothetical protein